MMRMKTTPAAAPPPPANEPAKWEVRPCGMLVQKRNSDEGAAAAGPVPSFRLRVKHGSIYHEIYISSQATFGDLKKLVGEKTGLHPQDQKIVFKDKERDSAAFLDISGVKNRSKIVVLEDTAAQAKRVLEMRRAKKMEKAVRLVSEISLEVDKLASQVSALEVVISKGGRVSESELGRLIELLMNDLLKLDCISADGEAKIQRRMLVRRVQKYVETLDEIKIKNAKPKTCKGETPPVIVTTKWETFDSLFSPRASASTSASTSATTTASSTAASSASPTPRFDWELF